MADIVPSAAVGSPAIEYRDRLHARQETRARWTAIDARVSYTRLVTFFAAVALAVMGWWGLVTWWLLLAPIVLFVVLVIYHDRVLRARDAAARAIGFYERGLARIEDRWIGGGEPGDRFRDDHHLYANDLDLFGRGSLFELLSIARTRRGEDTLAGWLTTPGTARDIRERQEAISELTPALDLREALSIVGAEVRASIDRDALVAWAEGPAILAPRSRRILPIVLTAATVATIVSYAVTGNATPLQIAILVQSLAAWAMRDRIDHALHAADGPARDLDVLAQLLTRLERERFSSRRLVALRDRLETTGHPASSIIRSLHWLMEMHDWQHNLVFMPIALVLLWGTHLAWAVEAWRARHGAHIRQWLDTVGELEALSSLSAYRFEHPDDPFPEIVEDGPALLEGRDLGHPLLPTTRMVRNDVQLAGDTRLLVVSGSNMSGKSTLLRTVGINAVLALAGAPVRASALRLTLFNVGATLRIQDSLQEGRSRFYAEITRIRELADTARGPLPLLFLLDELFHGTNSHDRLVGASGVLRALLDSGAIGLITTHDLALTAVADDLAPRAVNVHFEDWFDGNELQFDYRMKAGPVTRSNAIALMRAVGLQVAE